MQEALRNGLSHALFDDVSAQIIAFPMKRDLPNRIREWRKRAGWTQAELAFRCNCSTPQISDLEIGNVELSLKWMRTVAEALSQRDGLYVSPADLLSASDNPRFSDPGQAHWNALYEQADDDGRKLLLRVSEAASGFSVGPDFAGERKAG